MQSQITILGYIFGLFLKKLKTLELNWPYDTIFGISVSENEKLVSL